MSIRFRLPTKAEFERLSKCWSRFDEKKNGRWFFDEETGQKLFLPCRGYITDKGFHGGEGTLGYYWSSNEEDDDAAYVLYFNYVCLDHEVFEEKTDCHSVRLVSDAPFGDARCVAGLYWKAENEDGYYSYDDAMSKFKTNNNEKF